MMNTTPITPNNTTSTTVTPNPTIQSNQDIDTTTLHLHPPPDPPSPSPSPPPPPESNQNINTTAPPAPPSHPPSPPPLPDQPNPNRLIAHFRIDAFYVSCEQLFDASLRDTPVGVYIPSLTSISRSGSDSGSSLPPPSYIPSHRIITAPAGIPSSLMQSYEKELLISTSEKAFENGVVVGDTIKDAVAKCPSLKVLHCPVKTTHSPTLTPDLTNYELKSDELTSHLSQYLRSTAASYAAPPSATNPSTPPPILMERESPTSLFVDITHIVNAMIFLILEEINAGQLDSTWDTIHKSAAKTNVAGRGNANDWWNRSLCEWTEEEIRLACGSAVASRVSDAFRESQPFFYLSVGVSGSKSFARLASGLNGWGSQTSLDASDAEVIRRVLHPMRLEELKEVGIRYGDEALRVVKGGGGGGVAEVAGLELSALVGMLGRDKGRYLYDMLRGRCYSSIVSKGEDLQCLSCEITLPKGTTVFSLRPPSLPPSVAQAIENNRNMPPLLSLMEAVAELLFVDHHTNHREPTKMTVHVAVNGRHIPLMRTYRTPLQLAEYAVFFVRQMDEMIAEAKEERGSDADGMVLNVRLELHDFYQALPRWHYDSVIEGNRQMRMLYGINNMKSSDTGMTVFTSPTASVVAAAATVSSSCTIAKTTAVKIKTESTNMTGGVNPIKSEPLDENHSLLKKKRDRVPFTDQEKAAIMKGVKEIGVGRWKDIKNAYKVELQRCTGTQIKDCYRTMVSSSQYHNGRTRNFFTLEEKKAIVEGIEKFGVGCWMKIKRTYEKELQGRTSIQIKDCFRTMTGKRRYKNNKPDAVLNIMLKPPPFKKEEPNGDDPTAAAAVTPTAVPSEGITTTIVTSEPLIQSLPDKITITPGQKKRVSNPAKKKVIKTPTAIKKKPPKKQLIHKSSPTTSAIPRARKQPSPPLKKSPPRASLLSTTHTNVLPSAIPPTHSIAPAAAAPPRAALLPPTHTTILPSAIPPTHSITPAAAAAAAAAVALATAAAATQPTQLVERNDAQHKASFLEQLSGEEKRFLEKLSWDAQRQQHQQLQQQMGGNGGNNGQDGGGSEGSIYHSV